MFWCGSAVFVLVNRALDPEVRSLTLQIQPKCPNLCVLGVCPSFPWWGDRKLAQAPIIPSMSHFFSRLLDLKNFSRPQRLCCFRHKEWRSARLYFLLQWRTEMEIKGPSAWKHDVLPHPGSAWFPLLLRRGKSHSLDQFAEQKAKSFAVLNPKSLSL